MGYKVLNITVNGSGDGSATVNIPGDSLLYGVQYTDMCAFRAIRRDALLGLGMSEMTYGWNIEMQMRAPVTGVSLPTGGQGPQLQVQGLGTLKLSDVKEVG